MTAYKGKKIDKYYEINVDPVSQNLHLTIEDENLPGEIKMALEKLLMPSKPEDSN